ncbi:hypothetical protein JTB14_026367 [Gonioctena quinquepunctata]|nr:hypothetical protein JTB14_026367 [Gonioctena quinquepunctata]
MNAFQETVNAFQGLRDDVDSIIEELSSGDFQFICITEIWLNDNILSSELLSLSYIVHRNNCDPVLSGKCEGGGVLVAVSSAFSSTHIPEWSSTGLIEEICTSVILDKGEQLWLCCVYAPPICEAVDYINHMNKVEEIINANHNEYVIIIGDYNLLNSQWRETAHATLGLLPFNVSDISELFVNNISLLELGQLNNI